MLALEYHENPEQVPNVGVVDNHIMPTMLFRWMAQEGIRIGSEKQQRRLSKEIVSVEIQAETAPFTFSLKRGGEEVRASAIAYLPCLKDKVTDQHSRYEGC